MEHIGGRLDKIEQNMKLNTADLVVYRVDIAGLADGKRAGEFNFSIFEAALHRARVKRVPSDGVLDALLELGIELALQNDNVLDFPHVDLTRSLTALEARHVTEQLIDVQTRIEHDERIHALFAEGLCALYTTLLDELPLSAFQEDGASFSVPLYALADPAALVARFLGVFLQDLVPDAPDAIAALAFMRTRLRLWENLLQVSRMTPEQVETAPHRIVATKDCQLPPPDMIAAYLAGTPMAVFAEISLPFSIPLEARFEHMHIVGGAGHGKTQTLQHLIATDLASSDPPSLIIIDSHGDMLAAIERLDLFHPTHGRLTDRLIIIDPEDVEHPPALNMFDMSSSRLASYTPAQREQVEAATIELYDYIFRALSADLTSKQGVAFAFVARLLLTIPGATIHTLRELMEDQSASIDKSPFHDAISRLDDTARAFFELHFFTKAFADIKRQIARRIYDFIRNKTFERMFSSPVNKLDMFEAMNSGAIVLVNTSKALLKSAASALFGRTMIALTLRAAFERVAIAPEQRRPTFLIIDEAADYFDANVDALLTQVREFKLGLVFAHQYLDQLDAGLRASFAAIRLSSLQAASPTKMPAHSRPTCAADLSSSLRSASITITQFSLRIFATSPPPLSRCKCRSAPSIACRECRHPPTRHCVNAIVSAMRFAGRRAFNPGGDCAARSACRRRGRLELGSVVRLTATGRVTARQPLSCRGRSRHEKAPGSYSGGRSFSGGVAAVDRLA